MRSNKIKILVVDDEELILKAFSRLMLNSRDKYDPEFFLSPEKALKAVSSNPDRYQVILTDIRMPHMNGIQFAKEVKILCPDLPVVFMTGFSSPQLKEKAVELKKVIYLEKPFPLISVLDETIPNLLREK